MLFAALSLAFALVAHFAVQENTTAGSRPDWARAELVIEGKRFPLIEVEPPAEPASPSLPDTWASEQTVAAHVVLEGVVDGEPRVHTALLVRRVETGPDGEPLRRTRWEYELVGGPEGAEPAWRMALEETPRFEMEPAQLFADDEPYRAEGDLPSLTVFAGAVLVAFGERSDLFTVDARTGEVLERLERPWEIERGFIGPSVWQSRLWRFGAWEYRRDVPSAEVVAELRANFEARCTSWIVGSPIVCGDRVQVAIARAAPGEWTRRTAEIVVLELGAQLGVVTLTPLPAPISGHPARAIDGAVLWPLTGSMLACIESTSSANVHTRGPGGHDRRARMRWLVSAIDAPADAFMVMPVRSTAPLVLTRHCARVSAAPYVHTNNLNRLHLPIEVRRLADADVVHVEVEVPLSASMPAPLLGVPRDDEGVYRPTETLLGALGGLELVQRTSAGGSAETRLVMRVVDVLGERFLEAPAAALEFLDD